MRAKWTQTGALAIAPSALGAEFDAPDLSGPGFSAAGTQIALVSIRGPLTHHASWCWDSYDAIKARVAAALASPAAAVVLDLDTPGGEVFGAFETAKAIRGMAAAAGKPLFAFTEAIAASAGYALACAASRVFVTPAAHVGSVGVINALFDQTELDTTLGLRFVVVGSGARKTDGCPHVSISDEAVAELTARVDELAGLFFAWVGEARGGSPESFGALEAKVFIGSSALAVGLADEVVDTREAMLAAVATIITTASAVPPKEAAMADDEKKDDEKKSYEDEMRAKLEEDSKSDDEKTAGAAKKMLAALDGDDDEKKDEKKKKDDDAGDAEEKKSPPSDDEEDGGGNAAASASVAPALAAEIRRELELRDRKAERARMIAERPDLSKPLALRLSKLKLETVKSVLAEIPRPAPKNLAAAAQPSVDAAVPHGVMGGRATRSSPEVKAKLDERMGLKAVSDGGITKDQHFLTLGIVPRKRDQKVPAGTPGKVA